MKLRPYQNDVDIAIDEAWNDGARNVLAVLPAGSGKTVLFTNRVLQHDGASVSIAHRRELVGQMSRTFARNGIKHRIIGPKNVIKSIISSHLIEFGRDFYDPSARCAVAGVDTLVSWMKPESKQHAALMRWASQVTLWIVDEAHHCLGNGISSGIDTGQGNKWGKAISLFQRARGLGVTATPLRADGRGLGRHADGPFDTMVEGPQMRSLIEMKYLTDYRIFCPPSDLDLSTVATGADGDYVRGQLSLKTRSSTIMGHVVESYLRIAPGRLGVTFAPDVETASMFSKLFNEAGVPAQIVTAKTPDKERTEIMKRFTQRRLLQLVNVDLFGEGLDIPAIEVVSMARATMSYSLFVQQFGRCQRLMEGKERGIVIDHVGNVLRHGLPDARRIWTLDRREKRSGSAKDPDLIPMRVCSNPDVGGGVPCAAPYPRTDGACPYCGWVPTPAGRTSPEMTDGDLFELTSEVLVAMRGELTKIDRHPDEVRRAMERSGAPPVVCHSAAKQHAARQEAQSSLREAASWFMGFQKAMGRDISEAQKRFYFAFNVDVLSAQCLGRPEAEDLTSKIYLAIERMSR